MKLISLASDFEKDDRTSVDGAWRCSPGEVPSILVKRCWDNMLQLVKLALSVRYMLVVLANPVIAAVWNYRGLPPEDMTRRVVYSSECQFSATVNMDGDQTIIAEGYRLDVV